MNLIDIRSSVEPYLAKLAACTTSDEIKDFLVAEGVQGIQSRLLSCPIARYVSSGSEQCVVVTEEALFVTNESGIEQIEQLTSAQEGAIASLAIPGLEPFRHTAAMEEFILKFDCGYYPELVANE